MKKVTSSSSSPHPQKTISFRLFWWILLFVSLGGGILFLWFFNLPYLQAHEYARWLSPSHRLSSFTIEIFEQIQPIGYVMAGLLLTAGIYMLLFPNRTKDIVARFFNWLVSQIRCLPSDCAHLWQDFRPHRAGWFYLVIVLLLTFSGILLRALFLTLPMRHDESYTVVVFAMRPWLKLISDYHLPNNHIFHSILVKLAINFLGTAPWEVRLPAFLSGVLCVPAGYLAARQLYGRIPAVLSAGLIAALPMLISFSTNARGYSQYILFGLVLLSLAIYLSKHANLAGWILFVFIAVAGFYTVPFMLFPFGAVCLWLVVSALVGETHQAYNSLWGFLKYLFIAGVSIVLFTILLYSPIVVIGSGLNSMVGNTFVTPLSWSRFWPALGKHINTTWMEWNYDLPQAIQIISVVGVCLSLIFHRRISQVRIPIQITTFVWILLVLVILRSDPWDRLWSFIIPLWLIWASGGLLTPLTNLKLPWKKLGMLLVIGSLLITLGWSVQRVHFYFPEWQGEPGQVELAAEYLSQHLVTGDAIALTFPDDAPYWYYLGKLGVADEYMHQIELNTHKRVYIVVNESYGQNPTLVLQTRGLSPEDYQVDKAELVFQYAHQEIYLCLHR